jgi:succinoglycan biosynthesis protein ExoA
MSQSDRRTAPGPLVVVPCLNEAEHLHELLGTLLADPGVAGGLIVVVDGGSADASRSIVKAWAARDERVRLMHNPQGLQSAGVNRAARAFAAGRRWLVRIDAHAEYPRDYVARLVEEAERTGASSVVVRMVTLGATPFQSAAAAAMNSHLGTGGADHRTGSHCGWVDHGHHALFDLRSFLALGGYDSTFDCNEDAEFDERLRAGGGGIWLTDRVQAAYHPRRSLGSLFGQYLAYGRGRARTALKHRFRLRLRQLAPLAVAPAVIIAPFGWDAWPLAVPAAIWTSACLIGGLGLWAQRREPAAAGAGLVAMIMHLGWSLGFWGQLVRAAAAPFRRASASELRRP